MNVPDCGHEDCAGQATACPDLGLTPREIQVLTQIAQGKTNYEIAAALYLSENTIKSYIRMLYRKIGVTSRTQALIWANRNGVSHE